MPPWLLALNLLLNNYPALVEMVRLGQPGLPPLKPEELEFLQSAMNKAVDKARADVEALRVGEQGS